MDHFDAGHLTPVQCRARAEFIRQTADTVSAKELRQQLLDLAKQFERLAHSQETRRINDAA